MATGEQAVFCFPKAPLGSVRKLSFGEGEAPAEPLSLPFTAAQQELRPPHESKKGVFGRSLANPQALFDLLFDPAGVGPPVDLV